MAELRVRFEPGDIDVDNGKLEALFRDPSGPLVRDLTRRANNVESTAWFDAPRNTGLMASTIRSQMDFSGPLPIAEVIVGKEGLTPQVGYVIFGTKPHVISAIPNRPNPHLRFINRAGQVVFAKRTFHPGTRPDDFVQRALLRAAD